MTDPTDEIKDLKVRVYDLSAMRVQIDQEINQLNMRIAELSQQLMEQNGTPVASAVTEEA